LASHFDQQNVICVDPVLVMPCSALPAQYIMAPGLHDLPVALDNSGAVGNDQDFLFRAAVRRMGAGAWIESGHPGTKLLQ
jgi:hypothetical protein